MRLLVIMALLANVAFAHVSEQKDINQGMNKEKVVYASLYADTLIKEFDNLLDYKLMTYSPESPMYSDIYAKILSARNYIEQFKGHQKALQIPTHLLTIRNPKLYSNVVDEIDTQSIQIIEKQIRLKEKMNSNPVLYPSVTGSGTVTGNTYPKGVWSFTFDDGPRVKRTATVVDNLYKRNISATFFMLTQEAKKYTDEALNVVNSGMTVGLHSYTHPDLNKATDAELAYQITQAKIDLEAIINYDIKFFRLPYGSGMRNMKVRKLLVKNNFINTFWNIDTLDWKDKNPTSILARLKKQMKLTPHNSGIILFHDIHPQSVIASEMAMDYLLDENYTICTVPEVVSHINGHNEDCLKGPKR